MTRKTRLQGRREAEAAQMTSMLIKHARTLDTNDPADRSPDVSKKRKPCKECPFRRASLPGYLGECSHAPVEFLMQLETPSAIPCHLTVDWNVEPPDFSKAKECVGALQFMNNSPKVSRFKEVAMLQRKYEKNEDVFQWQSEFIDHHKAPTP